MRGVIQGARGIPRKLRAGWLLAAIAERFPESGQVRLALSDTIGYLLDSIAG